jgi:hypothetical protein
MTNKELEKERQKTEKYKVFMGSIMVCVVYAVIAIVLAFIIYFTEMGKELEKSLGIFMRTYIIGTILIIIAIFFMIYDWKPSEKKVVKRDVLNPKSCPDYWTVTSPGDLVLNNNVNVNSSNIMGESTVFYRDYKYTEAKDNLFNNKCINDTNIRTSIDGKNIADLTNMTTYPNYSSNITGNVDKATFVAGLAAMNLAEVTTQPTSADFDTYFASTNKIKCDMVFPEYLADLDAKNYAENNYTGPTNKFRCEYAKMCGVPWTDIGC